MDLKQKARELNTQIHNHGALRTPNECTAIFLAFAHAVERDTVERAASVIKAILDAPPVPPKSDAPLSEALAAIRPLFDQVVLPDSDPQVPFDNPLWSQADAARNKALRKDANDHISASATRLRWCGGGSW